MKKITTLKGQHAEELAKLLQSLDFLPVVEIVSGAMSQQIGENAYIFIDMTNIIGKIKLTISMEKFQLKALKSLDPGNGDVEIFETDDAYRMVGGNFDVQITKQPARIWGGEVNIPEFSTESGFFSLSPTAKAFDSIVIKNGPCCFDFDNEGNCISITNSGGTRYRINPQTMIPPEQRDCEQEIIYKLFSFWMHEIEGQEWEIILHTQPSVDASRGEADYWMSCKVQVGSGLNIFLTEKLLPKFW